MIMISQSPKRPLQDSVVSALFSRDDSKKPCRPGKESRKSGAAELVRGVLFRHASSYCASRNLARQHAKIIHSGMRWPHEARSSEDRFKGRPQGRCQRAFFKPSTPTPRAPLPSHIFLAVSQRPRVPRATCESAFSGLAA